MDAYMEVMSKYAQFSGRAGRREFWMFVLINMIISFVLGFVLGMVGLPKLAYLYSLAVFVPSIAVAVRRLHDTGKSGLWYLIAFTIVGIIPLIFFWAQEGDAGANAYGPPASGAAAFA